MKQCKECSADVDLKAGDEITPEIERLSPDYGEVELCRSCFSKSWSFDPTEIIEGLSKDSHFLLGIQLPIHRYDL